MNNRTLPNYNRPTFYPHEAAAKLMIQASAQFPDIEVEDLDVRSLEQVGDVHARTSLGPQAPASLGGRFPFRVDETYTFRGVVVKRTGNNP